MFLQRPRLLHRLRQRWWLPPLKRATWDPSTRVPTTPWGSCRPLQSARSHEQTTWCCERQRGSAGRSPNIQPTASTCASCFHQDAWQGIQCRGEVGAAKAIDEQRIGTPKGGCNLFRREQRAVRGHSGFSKHHGDAVCLGLGVQCAWMAHLQHDHAGQAPRQTWASLHDELA